MTRRALELTWPKPAVAVVLHVACRNAVNTWIDIIIETRARKEVHHFLARILSERRKMLLKPKSSEFDKNILLFFQYDCFVYTPPRQWFCLLIGRCLFKFLFERSEFLIRAKRVSNSHLRPPRNSALLAKKKFVYLCVCTL